ncbi:MAG: circadian clock protein KaiC [Marmoricola sp.]|nr:circadian clock protein KaiC [Marmoricola sp.]
MSERGEEPVGLEKAPTGIAGFDEITGGGVPRGRPTLVTGAAGSGKTLFGIEFLVRGARDHGEPGVMIAFEESAPDLAVNVASLGFDLEAMQRDGTLLIDAVHLDPSEFVESGAFDLEGLFIRLASAVAEVGAKRIVLDTIELLFSALPNEAVVRGELGRLFRWLKDQGLTTVITGERGNKAGQLTRYGIEEYVSDCVVVLDHRVTDELSTRRLRVTKYRGTVHGTNEYPFLISDKGIVVVPITSIALEHQASEERVPSGVPQLDEMMGGGIYRGSTAMISGSAGTGKTSIAAAFAQAGCERGDRVLFVSFEESPSQLIRNMASIGIDLRRWVDAGLLRIESVRPTAFGLEEHLALLMRLVDDAEPQLVVLDAIGSMGKAGALHDSAQAVSRDVDLLKSRGITGVMTTLSHSSGDASSEIDVSSLVDTWLLLRNHETNGERNRLMFVIKSRGIAHSNQVREFLLTGEGPQLVEVYVGPEGVLTGSARVSRMEQEEAAREAHAVEGERRRLALAQRKASLQAQIADLQAQLMAEDVAYSAFLDAEDAGQSRGTSDREAQAQRLSTLGAQQKDNGHQPGGES